MLFASKIIFTCLCLFTVGMNSGFGLNKTHATNPLWPPHARFHFASEFMNVAFVQCAALFLVWGNYPDKGSELATWVTGLALIAFWGTFIPASLWPGARPWIDGRPVPKYLPPFFKRYAPPLWISAAVCLLAGFGIWLDVNSRK